MSNSPVNNRIVLKKTDLEKKLLAYLRKSGRCMDAAGVVVRPVPETAARRANWTIAAVNYGRAPKADCDEELTRIAPLFLRHFSIAAEPALPASPDDAGSDVIETTSAA